MQPQAYDFPVELQKVFTRGHKEVPRARAVIRKDTGDPIANVSDRYHLVSHKTVIDEAKSFVSLFGTPEEKFHMGTNGVTLVGEYTYKDITRAVRRNDLVGLRVYVENSYNTSKGICYRLGTQRPALRHGPRRFR